MLFITVQPDGTLTEKDVALGSSYEALRAGVQGWIEPHDYAENLTHYHNEEFLYAEGEVFNQLNLTAFLLSGGAQFYGPVVYTGGIDDEGDTRGVSEDIAEVVRAQAQVVRDNLAELLARTADIPKPVPGFTITTF